MAKSDENQPVDSGVGLLEVRLGACLSSPSRRMVADLDDTAQQCMTIRNAALRWWQRWREDNPTWEPVKKELLPSEVSNLMRAAMVSAHPGVGSSIVTQCIGNVTDNLLSRMPWNHHGKARYRWQAILWHEVNASTFQEQVIPLHNSTLRLCYVGEMAGAQKGPVATQVLECGQSSAVAAFQLFSKNSGRDSTNVIARIEARQLTPGNRLVLRRVALGEWKMRDSSIVYKEGKARGKQRRKAKHNGAWFLQLCYHQPRVLFGLNKDRVATLDPQLPSGSRPFIIRAGGSTRFLSRATPMMVAETHRLAVRRAHLRKRYPVRGHGPRGHGRQRFERDNRPLTRAIRDLAERFIDGMVAEVVQFCKDQDCGTVCYYEPAVQSRTRYWFAGHDVYFDWTSFWTKLQQKCWHHGIELNKERKKRGDSPGGAAVPVAPASPVMPGAAQSTRTSKAKKVKR